MIDQNFNNVFCSRRCQDFTLLYDGQGTYYLFYVSDLLLEINKELDPKQLHKEYNTKLFAVYSKIKDNPIDDFIGNILKTIADTIGDNKGNDRKISTIAGDLIRSIKDAYSQGQNREYFANAPQKVLDKAMTISENKGYGAEAFEDLMTPKSIEDEINARANPVLTKKEKAKADAIANEVNNNGLLHYLESILDNIHIGEHKNIYRKILMLFKIMRGEASFLSETTAKAEAGKSFEDEIVFNMIAPQRYIFKVNDITSASFKRYSALNPMYFDRQIILFGDLGSKKSFAQIEDVFNIFKVLITENEYSSTKSDKNDELSIIELNLKVDSIGAAYSTIENSFTKDDNQLISRTLFSTPAMVNPKDIARQIFYLQNPHSKQSKLRAKAEQDLKDFGLYLLKMVNSDIEIINPYLDVFWDYASKSDNQIREFNQQLELFNAYCILTQDKAKEEAYRYIFASEEQLKEYMDLINLENALIPYEYNFLEMLLAKGKANEMTILYTENDFYNADGVQLQYNYLKETYAGEPIFDADGNQYDIDPKNIVTMTECENTAIELLNDAEIQSKADLNPTHLKTLPYKLIAAYGLRSAGANHTGNKIFFRYTDIKNIYSRYSAFKNIENVPQLLQTLYNKGYLGKYELKQEKENLYYLTPMCNNLTSDFELEKSYNRYVMDYYAEADLYLEPKL